MSCTEQIIAQIRSRGFRLTMQRLVILQVLQHSGKHLTPIEVCTLAQQSLPGLKESTVYRTLEFLEKNGFALAAHVGSGKLIYEISGHDHHHVICTKCGKEMEVGHDQLISLYSNIEKSTGYRLTTSHLTFFGLCPDCQ
jgi:Fe2+ or Zn2+ uptake regulation protein